MGCDIELGLLNAICADVLEHDFERRPWNVILDRANGDDFELAQTDQI
mgnify:CR=1 FL=1